MTIKTSRKHPSVPGGHAAMKPNLDGSVENMKIAAPDIGRDASAVDQHEVVSLYEAGKRIGLMEKSRRNYSDFLKPLCRKGGIEVRLDDAGVACVRGSDVPALARLVQERLDRRWSLPARDRERASL